MSPSPSSQGSGLEEISGVEGRPSEGITFQNSCTSTVLVSSCLCCHQVSSLTMGAVDRARREGQEGPWRLDRILMSSPSPSPPSYPVVRWSAPAWGSSHSSGQAGASGCSASAGRRLWMGGARRAHAGRCWRAGSPPGGGGLGSELGSLCPPGLAQLTLPSATPTPGL